MVCRGALVQLSYRVVADLTGHRGDKRRISPKISIGKSWIIVEVMDTDGERDENGEVEKFTSVFWFSECLRYVL